MKYGQFRDSEFLWDNDEQKLFRKLIEPNCKNHHFNNEEFKEVTLKPQKSHCGKGKEYFLFRINRNTYKLHRLVYYLYNQDWNIYDSSMNNFIDHRDGNGLNNRIENLNLVTNQQNTQNRKNAKGYYKEGNRIMANFMKDGKQIRKSFNINKYGYEKALELAKAWREENTKHYYKG